MLKLDKIQHFSNQYPLDKGYYICEDKALTKARETIRERKPLKDIEQRNDAMRNILHDSLVGHKKNYTFLNIYRIFY